MTIPKKSPVKIAKSGAKKPTARKKPVARKKPAAKKPVAPKLTAEQERDQKARAKVDELLKDSTLTAPPKDDLLVLDESNDEPKGVEWLEEQVTLQGTEIERLRKELGIEKGKNTKLPASGGASDGELQKAVTTLFNELQTNYLKMGKNPSTGASNLVLPPVAFMNRMIMFFPFLKKNKQF